MKKSLLLICSLFAISNLAFAQCGDLFFSEYVEGYANNKAVEIYNPTGQAIQLSDYSIARFSNGSTVAPPPSETPSYVIQLPDHMLEPYDVYVVVVDLTDVDDWDTQFDKPAWNGFNILDTLRDQVTNEPLLDSDGMVIIGPQYIDNGNGPSAVFGTDYNERYDLQGKADAFLCPDYATNRTMYFNGNDAVVLMKGTELANDGSNLVDVIGVIGEDPEATIDEDAWISPEGFWLTKDRTLVRQPNIAEGRTAINEVVFSQGGTFEGKEWDSWFKNTFCFLGVHVCDCDPNPPALSYTTDCGFDPDSFSSTKEFNQIDFKMYPNPLTSNALTIQAAEAIHGIQVFNLMGQQVYEQSLDGYSNFAKISLPANVRDFLIVKVEFADQQISVQKLIRK